jgi:hypothetical protein
VKKIVLLSILLLSAFYSQAQQEHAWIYLDSKEQVASYIANPLTMLSQRALDRRTSQGIAIDFSDVPVSASYISAISAVSGITYIGASKWLNALHVVGTEATINALQTSFSYIDHIEFANDSLNTFANHLPNENSSLGDVHNNKFPEESNAIIFNYGQAANQIEMFNAHKLHEMNYTGGSKIIAVIDAGFPNVDTNTGFERIRTNGQILGGYDFVNGSSNFYTGHAHGSNVLAFMAGYYSGGSNYVGSAPDANYYLYISEDVTSETPAEEMYWVMAAEQADYVGADIINTSLGYFTFDESKYNYDYTTDLDGNTAFISRGAALAFSKGMVIVNAAGNEGNNTGWGRRVLVPADAPDVLSVGAVNATGNYASFSSRGPTSDSRLKPDVCVQGQSAYYINTGGSVTTGSGTSYASPLLAGGIACLWEALPGKTNAEIIQFVKESASLYTAPTFELGHGIPDLDLAVVLSNDTPTEADIFGMYPNPVNNVLHVTIPANHTQAHVTLYDILGSKIAAYELSNQNSIIDLSSVSSGVYFVAFKDGSLVQTLKLIKE